MSQQPEQFGDYIKRVLADAPPLTEEKREYITRIFQTAKSGDVK
ncbi:hypothetical protein [Corynebacterium epidermidicanis]|nr:hypothetical protein [Corynebacterium epidermidicanis]